jgi:adenine deaminase
MSGDPVYSEEEARYHMWRWQWRRRIAVEQGHYPPALLLKGGRVVNVFTGRIVEADVAIDAGRIVGVGSFAEGRETVDVTGLVLAPSFIDPHLHLESTLLWPPELARAVVPHGTGAIVTDPHEVANVAGVTGVEALRDAARSLPLDIRFTAPSCVPASPHETSGAEFTLEDITHMLEWPETAALGEMMNFPGVLGADPGIAARIYAASGYPRDGHAPGLTGQRLHAYVAAGMDSDHESISLDEARAKLEAGMLIMMRQGSSEKNLIEILPLVTESTWHRITFCSDDRDCHDLRDQGHLDDILRTAIGAGLDPVRAIQMATWVPARHWRLEALGAIAPGYRANLVALSNLDTVAVEHTLHNGQIVASAGHMVAEIQSTPVPEVLSQTVNIAPVRRSHLALAPDKAGTAIELVPGQIVTRAIGVSGALTDIAGAVVASLDKDLLKIVCIERHRASGRIGVGLIRGFGFQRGAIASTVAHDAHNIIAVGANDDDILAAVAVVAESQGGLAVAADRDVLAHLPLPIGGLMSDGRLDDVAEGYAAVEDAARALGSTLASPFGQLAFLALSVIPEARITDRGFLDLRSIANGT